MKGFLQFCGENNFGSINHLKYQLARKKKNDVKLCPQVPINVKRECNVILINYYEKKLLKRKRSKVMSTLIS